MTMWKQIFDWLKGQFTLMGDVARLQHENTELKRKFEDNTDLLRQILFEMQRDRDHWRHEHEKLLLQLENELLKFERRLPPPRPPDEHH